jgi:hypothetical protein
VRRLAGQAVLLARLLVTGALVGLVALGLVAYRFSQGPIELPWLARVIAEQSPLGEGQLEIASARIAWRGWRSDRSSPVELRLGGLSVLDAAGAPRLVLPDATVQFSIRALVSGRVAPVALVFDGLSLALRRAADGTIGLDLGQPAAVAAAEVDAAAMLAALSRLVLRNTTLAIRDQESGLDATLSAGRLVLARGEAGLSAEGSGRLALGGAEVPVTFALDPPGEGHGGRLRVEVARLPPGALAGLPAAGFGTIDAPLALAATADLAPGGGIARLRAVLRAGEGRLPLPTGGSAAIEDAEITLASGPDLMPTARVVARLSPGPLGLAAPPLLAADVAMRRGADGALAAEVSARLDRLPLQGLLLLWPETVAPDARIWVVENFVSGMLHDAALSLTLAAAPGAMPEVTAAAGEARIAAAEVYWLRPLPRVEDGVGLLRFAGPEVTIDVAGGRIGTGGIRATGGRLRFHNLDALSSDQLADVGLALEGEVATLVALLSDPALGIADRRLLLLRRATGRFTGTLGVGLPLLAHVPPERITLAADVTVGDLRIPGLGAGQRLDQGEARIEVTERGLAAAGTARIADIPARIELALDFTSGPPTQVIERLRVEAQRAPAPALARALPALAALGPRGQADVTLAIETRRNGRAEVEIAADLARMALALAPLGWSKPAGRPGRVEAVLRLQAGRLVAADGVRITAPDLALAGRLAFGAGGRLQRAEIEELRLFGSRAAGEATAPARGGEPWRIALRGPVLDLAPMIAARAEAGGEGEEMPPLAIEARFERLLLGAGRELGGLDARVVTGPRGTMREARVFGRAGDPGGAFAIRVTPRGGGRDVAIEAADAGALMRAFNVTGAIEGGRLALSARWQGEGAGQPMTGTAEMTDFGVRDAPAIGRFLQAITVYGLADVARGPHLSFSRAVVPFTLSPGTLAIGEARAYSASLGVTVTGRVDRLRDTLDLSGTLVPAYMFNTIPGRLPLIGRLFSLESGGGLVAIGWRARGPSAEPEIVVNPLSALTPGFLRGLFGQAPGQDAAAPP